MSYSKYHTFMDIPCNILSIPLRSRVARYCLFYIALLILLQNCSTSTNPNTYTLMGNISLVNDTGNQMLDPIDFSGVTVSLYNLTNIDTTYSRINSEYSSIGIIANQQLEFNHSRCNPILTTQTDATGLFKLAGINAGKYNVVVSKNGWGYIYVIDYSVPQAKCTGETISRYQGNISSLNVVLYPETILSNIITNEFDFMADHTYYCTTNVTAMDTSTLLFEPGCRVIMNPGTTFDVYGEISFTPSVDSFSTFSCSDLDQKFSRFRVMPTAMVTNDMICNVIIDGAAEGICINKDGLSIQNCRGRFSISAISLVSANDVSIKNVVMSNSGYGDDGAIQIVGSQNYNINNAIMFSNQIGVKCRTSGGMITNSYFNSNNDFDINNNDESTGLIVKWCIFDNSNTAILNTYNSTASISYNTIIGKDGIINTFGRYTTISAQYNNLYCSNYAIKTQVSYYGNTDLVYIDASNNFWNTTDIEEIEGRLWDRYDEDPSSGSYTYLLGVIQYVPFRLTRITQAGIQEDR